MSALDPAHPALIAGAGGWGTGLGVVLVDYGTRWSGTHTFLQHHVPGSLLFYTSYAPAERAAKRLWAWLAPLPAEAASAARVEQLLADSRSIVAGFEPIAPPLPERWHRPLPEFPPALRRGAPVTDINEAAVYTINETTRHEAALDLARRVGSDLLIRGWFKWAQSPGFGKWRELPAKAHAFGALFGGGITCSALYDTENGITRAQLLDMATRGSDGQLVDAWDTPGVRHGSLSSAAYLDYLFGWCREQIDAGVDYLFMDEHQAALSEREGFDDHSLADFRRYLSEVHEPTRGWAPTDARWTERYGIDLANRTVCPSGGVDTFSYRAHLAAGGWLKQLHHPQNRVAPLWGQFRRWRDDRAWQALTDRIRAYSAQQGRRVLISANGIARYVDLQVLGVWDAWAAQQGRCDFGDSQLGHWRQLVRRGQTVAGRRVPVVLFHDWGFGETPFPFMAVSVADRELWMRIRGAEIYAAGGFFAYPVLGPFGCDAQQDGSLPTIAQQTRFFQTHRELFLRGRYVCADALSSETPHLSLALWAAPTPRRLAVHVINRAVREGQLEPRRDVTVRLPLGQVPRRAVAVSPDWDGERPVAAAVRDGRLQLALPALEAYAMVLLDFADEPDLSALVDAGRAMPAGRWEPGGRSEFKVLPDGSIEHADDLNAYQQGRLHTELRNPPTFIVNALTEGKLRLKVRAVATAGARLDYRVDGVTRQTVDLPDKDGKNDGSAAEYDQEFTFVVPAGRHQLTLDNVGGDWYTLSWIEFVGRFGP